MVNLTNLIKLSQAGNKEALLELLKMHDPLIIKKCNYYHIKGCEREDLYQIGVIEGISCIRKFDVNKHGSFVTYLGICIRNRFINEVKKAEKSYLNLCLERTIEEDIIATNILAQEEEDVEEKYIEKEEKETLMQRITGLSKEERDFIKIKYIDGKSTNFYSKEVGITHYKAAKLEKEIIKKLSDE